jgi:hypothetical protein
MYLFIWIVNWYAAFAMKNLILIHLSFRKTDPDLGSYIHDLCLNVYSIQCCVARWVVSSVLKEYSTFILNGQVDKGTFFLNIRNHSSSNATSQPWRTELSESYFSSQLLFSILLTSCNTFFSVFCGRHVCAQ